MKWILLFLGVFMLNVPKGLADVQYSGSMGFKIANIESFSTEERIQIFENLRNRPEFNSYESDIENFISISSHRPFSEIENDTLLTMFFDFRNLENLNVIKDYLNRITHHSEIQIVIIRDLKYREYETDGRGGINPWPWTSGGN